MNKGLADFGRAFRSTLISGVAYTCARQQPRGIQEGIDKGSARVTVTVSYDRIIFTVNQVVCNSASCCATSLKKVLEKEEIMVFSNPINIATAAMEDIFDRLCWLYATMRFTTVCDGSGNHHSLSDLTELSKVRIPSRAVC